MERLTDEEICKAIQCEDEQFCEGQKRDCDFIVWYRLVAQAQLEKCERDVRAKVEEVENPWALCEGEYPAAFKAIGFNFAKASILEALK